MRIFSPLTNISIVVLLLIFTAKFSFSQNEKGSDSGDKLLQVISNIENFYVDEISEEKLTEEAIAQLLLQLDPHSEYFSKDEADELMRNVKGSFEGVGITYKLVNDSIFILAVVPGGPSDKAGIKVGDRIVRINRQNVAGVNITNKDISDLLLGKKGSKVKVHLKRRGHASLIDKQITRDEVRPGSISAAYMLRPDIGYIKLDRFTMHAHIEFKDSLKMLKEKGARHLVFDLRGNSGGYLQTCVAIADEFWQTREIIVNTRGKNTESRVYETGREAIFSEGRLALLTDENSASASEIIAGAVQDLDRGIIMGKRSFGKGLVQRPFFLNDGSMIRLTVARYYTASGRCIQKSYQNGKEAYEKENRQRERNEAPADTGKIFFTKNNRKVYAEGAVYPDVYVPALTDSFTQSYRRALQTGGVYDAVHLYTDKYRKPLQALYPVFDDFRQSYQPDKLFWEELDANLPDSLAYDNFNKADIIHIKASIAGDLWGREHYFIFINEHSPVIEKAAAVLSRENAYHDLLLPETDNAHVWQR